MKVCLIDVGGGMRGIYAAGVLDRCLDLGISFDFGIGVSAGCANISAFIAGQKKRNYQFYSEYALRKDYMSMRNLLSKHMYLDLNYGYSVLSNSDGENPLDYDTFSKNPMGLVAVATNALTGKAKYFDKSDVSQNHYEVLKASAAIPLVSKPIVIYSTPYFDGAASDPIPINKAFELGCDKIVLLVTKPRNFIRRPIKDKVIASAIRKKYPAAAKQFVQRAKLYNDGMEKAKEYEKQGKLLIIAPDDTCGVDTLTKDKSAMDRLYQKGYADGDKIQSFLDNHITSH